MFYLLIIPDGIDDKTKILIIRLKAINDPLSRDDSQLDHFFNFHVSDSIPEPKNKETSQLYSETYGSDIVSRGKEEN